MVKAKTAGNVRQATRIGLFGTSGAGKTYQARELVRTCNRLIVVDPLGNWPREFRGLKVYHDLKALGAALRRNYAVGFRYFYQPRHGVEVADLETLSLIVIQVQEGFHQQHHQAKLTLVVDEADQCFPSGTTQKNPGNLFAFLCKRGRHYGVNLVVISQRTHQVDICFRNNMETCYFFRHAEARDIQAALTLIGSQYRENMRLLANYDYILYHNGQVSLKKFKN